MSTIVFTGPSLAADEARQILDATYLPPAAFGDVYRAALERPSVIAIIDGFFENQPAIWHKEILWAMKEGVHVFGASSMGALRAAELCELGMVGVGKVFSAFQSGELQDDDEVAISHGAADEGYRPLSVAMVDIRQTLSAAEQARVVATDDAEQLRALAKRLNFRERSYPRLLQAARAEGMALDALVTFERWLGTGQVQQKRADALELLSVLRAWHELKPGPKVVSYSFARTDAWETATARILAQRESPSAAGQDDSPALDELRISGEYPRVWQCALTRVLAIDLCRRLGREPDTRAMGRALDALRADLELKDDAAFAEWMKEEGVTESDLVGFAREEAVVRWGEALMAAAARRGLHNALRALGERGYWTSRGDEKRRLLENNRAVEMDPATVRERLLDWYFSECLGIEVPSDLGAHARSHGFEDEWSLFSAIAREHRARQLGLEPF